MIEGLSQTGDCYEEAVECLHSRYDHLRLIYQTHVKKILDAPSLKDGSGCELHRLHGTVLQHLRALKAMDYEPSGPFIKTQIGYKFVIQMAETQPGLWRGFTLYPKYGALPEHEILH